MYNLFILTTIVCFHFSSPLKADSKLEFNHEKHAFLTNVAFDSLKNKVNQIRKNIKSVLPKKSKKNDFKEEEEENVTTLEKRTIKRLLPESDYPPLSSIPKDELKRCLEILTTPNDWENARDNEIIQYKMSASQTEDIIEYYFLCKYHGLHREYHGP